MNRRSRLVLAIAAVLAAVLVPVVLLQSIPVTDLSEGLVVLFSVPQSSTDDGELRDLSESRNHGIVVGGSPRWIVDGTDSLQFSGAEQSPYVRVPVDGTASGDLTVVARVKNPRLDYHAGIVWSESWRLVATPGGFAFFAGESDVTAGNVAFGRWHHLAAVHRDGTLRLYVDGRLVDRADGADVPSTRTLLIGRRPSGYPFEGRLSEVRVYDRALTPEAVRGTYVGRQVIRPVFYTAAFADAAAVGIVLVAVVIGWMEPQLRSAWTPGRGEGTHDR